MDFYSDKGDIFCKAKSLISSVYGMLLWSTTLPSVPMQIPKQYYFPIISPGLKTLIHDSQMKSSPSPGFIVHSYMILSSPSPSPSSSLSPSPSTCSSLVQSSPFSSQSSSSTLDDLIGTDSGVYLEYSNEEEEEEEVAVEESRMEKMNDLGKQNQEDQDQYFQKEKKKKYPPPIPLLARTGNLPSHMPWILTRHYCNGRLILKKEKVKHHHYFEAHRENGCLTLKLVPLDDTIRFYHSVNGEKDYLELIQEEEDEEEDQESNDEDEDEEKLMGKSYLENRIERHEDLRKCFTYNNLSSCNAINGSSYMTQSGSAANNLAFNTIRPLTAVV